MARFTHIVSRTRGPGPGLALAALLAVLITLLSPPALGTTHPCAPVGTLLAAEESAHGEPYADSADPAVTTAAIRSHRDATGERHAPPVSAPGASPDPATDRLRRAQPPVSAAGPPASEQPALRHGVRAPPSLSGT
ncbi:hypothetical protein OG806_32195 [Streptomyces sp. NBC_00882]|uniref:hypothetical protein n=1 Tax=Streptomyces TaxID=1883 RepID=UPI00386C9EA1|nr:hypothetical protein OH837_15405 [Streptomyces canus]WSZ33765.1 hypothetical protein OG806_32195 [Streptomyces sp. NBC_00882]WSZ60718.1 hypothetical protein OH824_31275 [Streptomyces canus]